MPTLAPKLPWQHAFAGGYPGRGGQPLPTDPDAIDYLNRVAAADGGVSVEVGIAQAIDAFVRGCKADTAGYAGDPTRSNWDAIKASCIMCGARTLSGALVPLKGTAPTPYNFASGDYSRSGSTPGLKGDGATKYLNTNRANNADGQDDHHLSVAVSSFHSRNATRAVIGVDTGSVGDSQLLTAESPARVFFRNNYSSTLVSLSSAATPVGFWGTSRLDSAFCTGRFAGVSENYADTSSTPVAGAISVFARSSSSYSDARLTFYSIGAALDLAALDERVTNLVTAIKFHSLTGLLPNDYDPATIAYITAAYAAGGAL